LFLSWITFLVHQVLWNSIVKIVVPSQTLRSQGRSRSLNTYFSDVTLFHEINDRGDVNICRVHMDLNVIDPLMKLLLWPKHEKQYTSAIGILDTYMIDYNVNGRWLYGVLCLCVSNKVLFNLELSFYIFLASMWLIREALCFYSFIQKIPSLKPLCRTIKIL
jgi:hypothetical protein